MKPRMRFTREGFLAIEPRAMFSLFGSSPEPTNRTVDGATIVTIRGPLEHHTGGFWDSYESLLERVDAACAASAPSIVLTVDSPGGELAGALEASRAIRQRAEEAGKTLVSYVEGDACSAAYALACSASQIVVAPTATLGSIGILAPRIDVTAMDQAIGTRFDFITSGARKTDGNPHTQMSDDELSAHQARVGELAQLFFQLVAEMRGLSVEAVAGFEAGVRIGASAVAEGLADRVETFDGLIAALATGGLAMAEEEKKDDDQEARAALGRIAEGDGEQAERARRALKALEGPGDDEEEEEDEEDEKKKKDDSAEKAGESASAQAASSTSADLAKLVQAQGARIQTLERERNTVRLSALFAGRPDLSKDLVAVLQTKAYAEAKQIVDSIPKPTLASNPAATAVVAATRGAGQEGGRPIGAPGCEALDEAFGLGTPKPALRREGTKAIFGALSGVKPTASSAPSGGQQ
jgi:ClpP class serine protease